MIVDEMNEEIAALEEQISDSTQEIDECRAEIEFLQDRIAEHHLLGVNLND